MIDHPSSPLAGRFNQQTVPFIIGLIWINLVDSWEADGFWAPSVAVVVKALYSRPSKQPSNQPAT